MRVFWSVHRPGDFTYGLPLATGLMCLHAVSGRGQRSGVGWRVGEAQEVPQSVHETQRAPVVLGLHRRVEGLHQTGLLQAESDRL